MADSESSKKITVTVKTPKEKQEIEIAPDCGVKEVIWNILLSPST